MENAISFLGLLFILGVGFLCSNNRQAISLRTVAWGLGLQFLFAVIILREGWTSYAGIAILVLLVVLFVFEDRLRRRLGGMAAAAAAAIAVSALAAGLGFGLARGAGDAVATAVIVAALLGSFVAAKLGRSAIAAPCFALALPVGLGSLIARGVDGRALFLAMSSKVAAFLSLSSSGAQFLFGKLADPALFDPSAGWPGIGFQFAFVVLPTIIFFSAFMSILYYFGILQIVVAAMAKFMRWTLRTSGSETVSCSANIFVGQTEAPFLIKPFLEEMTVSELHTVMVGGFATIAGGVLAAYVAMGVDPRHLIAASVMAAPAALVLGKVFYPETEHSKTAGDVEMPEIETADNLVGAAAAGTTDGLQLALNVGAMLIAFIALVATVNAGLASLERLIDPQLFGVADADAAGGGVYPGYFPGSLKDIFGFLLAPFAWLMGVPWKDAPAVGNLLGVKISLNEFVAYSVLKGHFAAHELSERAGVIATYALCGFANFSSIGIQIGGIGALAPSRRKDLARVGFRAMVAGALASCMTATVAGILL